MNRNALRFDPRTRRLRETYFNRPRAVRIDAERLERDQNIAIETLALFIRYFLTVSTPVPEAHQDAARAQGKARFEQFVEQLGRHLMRGRSLVRDVVEELHPDPMRMADEAVSAVAVDEREGAS